MGPVTRADSSAEFRERISRKNRLFVTSNTLACRFLDEGSTLRHKDYLHVHLAILDHTLKMAACLGIEFIGVAHESQ